MVVAFDSFASNLVAGDTTGTDIFVHDRQTGDTTRVSVDSSGNEANQSSFAPSISADGQVVAFQSNASNLVAGDTTGTDIFVHDRADDTTSRVSVASDGTEANNISFFPSISADGGAIAFVSSATNLVPGGTFGFFHVFVHDRVVNTAPVADAGPDQEVACTSVTATDATLDGSGSSDPDNDPLTFTWTNSFGTATGVSPTVSLGLGTSTITLEVSDGALTDTDTVDITVAAQVEGFLSPLAALVRDGDEPPLPNKAFKQKSTLPLKLRLFCDTQELTDVEVGPPKIFGLVAVDVAPVDLETIDRDSGESNDSGLEFRYSTDGEWAYNLSTKDLTAGNTYEVTIEMPDGLRYAARFALK